jgi:hypothetical protein
MLSAARGRTPSARRAWATPVIEAAAAVITLTVLAWLLWASGRGFDVTDEGFYLLTARHPEDVVSTPTLFYHLTSWLYWATGGSIAGLRMAGVLGTAAAGASLGVAAVSAPGGRRSWVAVSAVTMSALLAYVWLLLVPSYNTYAAWAVAGMTICALRGFTAAGRFPVNRTAWQAWLFGCGFFLGLSFFVKFPTAVAMGTILACAIGAWPGLSRRERAAAAAWIACGAAGLAALVFLVVVSPGVWWRHLISGLDQTQRLGAGHDVSAIGRYPRELWQHFSAGTPPVIWALWIVGFVSAAILAAASRRRTRRAAGLAAALVLAVAAAWSAVVMAAWLPPQVGFRYPTMERWLAFWFAPVEPFPLWVARFYLHWLILAMAIAAGAGLGAPLRRPTLAVPPPSPGDNRRRLIIILLLGGGTFAAAFGTRNPIYLNLMLALGSWGALLVLAVRFAAARLERPLVGDAALLAIVTLAAVHVAGGSVTVSYGMNDGLLRQTVATPVGEPPAHLSTDPATSRLIGDLRRQATACGFRVGDDLLAFHNLPGLVFAIGGRSPGLPWFTYDWPGSQGVNERGLESAGADRISRAFILQTPDAEPWLRTLAPLGIEFPGRYTYCGSVIRRIYGASTELKLWRPTPPDGSQDRNNQSPR